MNANPQKTFPSAVVQVRLLQDAIYSDEADLWAALLRYRPHIENYFQEISLNLVVHEEDGFAYLKQADQEDSAGIPRLFRRDKLTKGVAILGVVLREQLLQFDEKVHDESRLVMRKDEIMQLVTPFFPGSNDEIKADKRIEGYIFVGFPQPPCRRHHCQAAEQRTAVVPSVAGCARAIGVTAGAMILLNSGNAKNCGAALG